MPVQDRLKNFKNKGKDQDEMRKRRTEVNVEIRKQKKDDQLLKRRNIWDGERDLSLSPEQQKVPTLSFEEMKRGLLDSDPEVQLAACISARKILSREKNPPIDTFLEEGIIPTLVGFLSRDDNPTLQFEAAWAITNIASGTTEQTHAVVKENCIGPLVELLKSPHPNICEQAVWALGNIAGDGSSLRDLVTQHGVVPLLVSLVQPNVEVSFLKNITWTLSNLCRNKNPPPDFNAIRPMLPCLALLIHHPDEEVVADACWALSYLTDGPNERIQEVVDSGVVPRLVEILTLATNAGLKWLPLLSPSLRTLGNIVTGSETQTQAVIDAGALQIMPALLHYPKINIQKEAAWFVSNVAAGTPQQVQALFDNQLIQPLISVLDKGDYKCQKEAAWAVTNLTAGGTTENIITLVQAGVIPPMCNLLKSHEPKILLVLLEALTTILEIGKKVNEVEKLCLLLEECGGLDRIEGLQEHENEEVYQAALKIIENYFSQEEEELESMAPVVEQGSTAYQFSEPTQAPEGGFTF